MEVLVLQAPIQDSHQALHLAHHHHSDLLQLVLQVVDFLDYYWEHHYSGQMIRAVAVVEGSICVRIPSN